jgi:mannan endo-1,4-beta-mannosidase
MTGRHVSTPPARPDRRPRPARRAAALLAAVLTAAAAAAATAPTASAVTVTGTAGLSRSAVLAYLAGLPGHSANRVASGFFGGYSNNGFSLAQTSALQSQTGQWPAVLGCDYGAGWATAPDPTTLIDSSCNGALADHARAGGLVTVDVHYPSPGYANGGNLNTRLSSFADLLNPATATGARWRSYLDKTAQGLADLKAAGVTVLFRPFHEMNGDWFWWGSQDPGTFQQVWRQMHDYLVTTKGLDNLLWVYAPDMSRGNRTAFYPGADTVDIVGLDAYSDTPSTVPGYDEMVALGKPFALTEIGPSNTSAGSGTFDYSLWIRAIHDNFPRTSYFLAWNDKWGPQANQGAWNLFNDPWTVNRGELAIDPNGGGTGGTGGTAQSLFDFESGTAGWTGAGIAGGPWQVQEWASQGSSSLKADVDLGSRTVYLARTAGTDLTGRTALSADVHLAPWGSPGSGVTAKLYVKTGSAWTWTDGGPVTVTSGTTTLRLNLGSIAGLSDVREIGVQFVSPADSSGRSAVYVDNVTVS